MKTVAIDQFKAKCLHLIKEVADSKEQIIITKNGKPLVQLMPVTHVASEARKKLLGSVLFEKDILSPIDAEWGLK